MEPRTENLQTKNIKEFNTGDTIYLQRVERGYSYMYFCSFVKFEKGMVYGKVISTEPNPQLHKHLIGTEVRARVSKCALYGRDSKDSSRTYCHWFQKDGFIQIK